MLAENRPLQFNNVFDLDFKPGMVILLVDKNGDFWRTPLFQVNLAVVLKFDS